MSRREYEVDLVVNGIRIKKVVIDPHYEKKHSESINDELILELVKSLKGEVHIPQKIDPPFTYFVTDRAKNSKRYRLIWLLEDDEIYIGVVNTYRR